MTPRTSASEPEPLRDPGASEPGVERLRQARVRRTKEWGELFGEEAARGGAGPSPAEPDDTFFDQDAAGPPPSAGSASKPAGEGAFYDQDEEPWE